MTTPSSPLFKPPWLTTESYGLLLLLLSAVLYSGMGVFLKLASNTGLPSTQLVFVRALFQGALVVVGMVYCRAETDAQGAPASRLIWHPFGGTRSVQKLIVARGAIGGLGFVFYYYTISALPLGDAIALLSLYPVGTVFCARVALGESIRILHLVVAISSVVGAALISSPTFLFGSKEEEQGSEKDANSFGYLTGVLGACCASGVVTMIRKAGVVGAHTLQLLFSWATFGIVFSVLGFGFGSLVSNEDGGTWRLPPSVESWMYLLGMCIIGSAGHFLLNYAARLAPAGLAAITRSSDIMWAYLLELVVFHQKPTAVTCLGVLLISMSPVAIAVQKIRDEKYRLQVAPVATVDKDEEEADDDEMIEMGVSKTHGSNIKRMKQSEYSKVSPLEVDDDTFIENERTIDSIHR